MTRSTRCVRVWARDRSAGMAETPDVLTVPPETADTLPPVPARPDVAPVAPQVGDDPLGDVLASVRLTGALFFVVESSSPWCIDVPHTRRYAKDVLPGAQHVMSYHVAVEGEAFASVPGVEPVAYGAGDIIAFPHGDGYTLQSAPDTPPQYGPEDTLRFMRALADGSLPFVVAEGGGRPPRATTICGFLGCDARPFNPVLASLPRLLRLRRNGDGPDLLDRLIELTMAQAQAGDPGGRAVRVRFAELLFIELLRRYIDAPGEKPPGTLAALADPCLARALGAIHRRPEKDWSVAALAARAGVSRSVLTQRFAERVGQPPMQYLTRWRMQLAARLLSESELHVAEIGRRVGYESEMSFSRSFRRVTTMSPTQWRRTRSPSGT